MIGLLLIVFLCVAPCVVLSSNCSPGLLGSRLSVFPAQTIDFWIISDIPSDNATLEFFFAWDQDRLVNFETDLVKVRYSIVNLSVTPLECPEEPWGVDLREVWVQNFTASLNVPNNFAGHQVIAKTGPHIWTFTVNHLESAGSNDVVVLWNALTYVAYNGWSGRGVYGQNSNSIHSIYRPFEPAGVVGLQILQNIPAIPWLKRNGFSIENVHVATDLDVAFNCSSVSGAKIWIISGHPEYWTLSEKRCFETWLDGGGRLIYMAANGFWERVEVDNATQTFMEAKVDVHTIEGFEGQKGRKWNDMPGERRGASFTGAYFEDYSTYCIGGEYSVLLPGHWALKTARDLENGYVNFGTRFAGDAIPKVPYSGACGVNAEKYHMGADISILETPWGALNWESDIETADSPKIMDRIAYGTNTVDQDPQKGSPMLYIRQGKSCVFSTNSITSPWALQNDAVFSSIMGEVLKRFQKDAECPPLNSQPDQSLLFSLLFGTYIFFYLILILACIMKM